MGSLGIISRKLLLAAIFGLGAWGCSSSTGGGGGSGGTSSPPPGSGGAEAGGTGGGPTGSGGATTTVPSGGATGSGGASSSGGVRGTGGSATGSGGRAAGGASTGSGGSGRGGASTGSGGSGRGGASAGTGGARTGGTGAGGAGTGGAIADGGGTTPGDGCVIGTWPTADPSKVGPYKTVTENDVGPVAGDVRRRRYRAPVHHVPARQPGGGRAVPSGDHLGQRHGCHSEHVRDSAQELRLARVRRDWLEQHERRPRESAADDRGRDLGARAERRSGEQALPSHRHDPHRGDRPLAGCHGHHHGIRGQSHHDQHSD